MRIISQDRLVDLSYDGVSVCFNEETNSVIASLCAGNPKCFYLGTYSSKEKALKVMEMIRNAYLACNYDNSAYGFAATVGYVSNSFFLMPQDSEVDA